MENKRALFYILEAEYVDFRGFAKPRIKLMRAKFIRKLQILNSTNGCGKSTFISELNPFPINKSLFKKTGYKRITFQFGNDKYEVYSSHKENRLINLDDPDTNLCTGGTMSQLTQLIESIFGITPFTWAIAMGSLEFTKADKETRRKWIEVISGIDLDYPFKVLGKLTTALNGSRGVVKHLNTQLANEASKLLKYEDVQESIEIRDKLSQAIKEILMKRDLNANIEDPFKLENEIKELENEARTLFKRYGELDKVINPFSNLSTLEELTARINAIGSEVDQLTVEINGVINLQEDKEALLSKLESRGKVDIEAINKELKICNEFLDSARTYCTNGNSIINRYIRDVDSSIDFASVSGAPDFIISRVIQDLGLHDNSLQLVMSENDKLQLESKRADVQRELTNVNGTLSILRDEWKHHQSHSTEVDCPKCGNHFKTSADVLAELKVKAEKLSERIPKLESELEQLDSELATVYQPYESRAKLLDVLRTQLKDYPWYFEHLKEYLEEDVSVSQLAMKISKDNRQAYHIGVGIDMSDEIKRLTNIKENYEAVADITSSEALDIECQELTKRISELRRKRQVLIDEKDKLMDLNRLADTHVNHLRKLKSVLERLYNTRKAYVNNVDNYLLERMERDLQTRAADLTKKVNDNEILINLVNKLESMLEEEKTKVRVYKELEQALNTKTGIIGEQLVNYTAAFAKQITSAISNMWGYEMSIIPCSIDSKKGMTYLFPFDVGGDEPVPDVAFGSKSQVSVINLAIMLCTRMSLGLDRLPLFLDEVGGGFDTVHNTRLGEFIAMLLTDYDCSNLFLVHHDIAVRNMLGVHDMIVFDASQVVVEPNYNEHVTLEYYKE